MPFMDVLTEQILSHSRSAFDERSNSGQAEGQGSEGGADKQKEEVGGDEEGGRAHAALAPLLLLAH